MKIIWDAAHAILAKRYQPARCVSGASGGPRASAASPGTPDRVRRVRYPA